MRSCRKRKQVFLHKNLSNKEQALLVVKILQYHIANRRQSLATEPLSMRFEISCALESNNNRSILLLQKQKPIMALKKCCITDCPAAINSFTPFPQKDTKEYTYWLRACKESEANIIFTENPMVCVLHFRDMDKMPIRYVTKTDIERLVDDLARVNHCVAEWLLFVRTNAPEMEIDDNDVYSKAKEIGRVYQLPHFEFGVDFGWINIFDRYLHSRGIESWNPEVRKSRLENFQCDESVQDVEESIKSYDEALKRVQVLYMFCKRTNNKRALEVVEKLSAVLKERV